jgi:hypothetical protein
MVPGSQVSVIATSIVRGAVDISDVRDGSGVGRRITCHATLPFCIVKLHLWQKSTAVSSSRPIMFVNRFSKSEQVITETVVPLIVTVVHIIPHVHEIAHGGDSEP